MFCRNCGKELKDKAVVCSACGHPVIESDGREAATGEPWNWLVMALLFGGTLVFPPVGLVFGVMGLRNPAKRVQAAVLTTTSIFMILLMIAIILGL